MSSPKYLVQTANLVLHGYETLEILLIDLLLHKGERVTVFEARNVLGRILFYPVSESDLRARYEKREDA